MPVYLCQPGSGKPEPWRHGISVFASPFPIQAEYCHPVSPSSGHPTHAVASFSPGGGRDLLVAGGTATEPNADLNIDNDRTAETSAENTIAMGDRESRDQNSDENRGESGTQMSVARRQRRQNRQQQQQQQQPIRRVLHAEVVLVDDVCIAYGRFWLRLRWPGHKGGFAGYIAMGSVTETDNIASFSPAVTAPENLRDFLRVDLASEERGVADDGDLDDPAREETGSTPSSEPLESSMISLKCLRTGLMFQSSSAMKLLHMYDDGFNPPVALAPLPTEQVFCRICREGLHDDADEEQPRATEDADGELTRELSSGDNDAGLEEHSGSMHDGSHSVQLIEDSSTTGPVQPHPSYSANTEVQQNPMLAPCECSGSMAFVHYLCVEQWRCRSRHPEARNGLNCETCGTPYSLPAPSARPIHVPHVEQEDWLDAMPPHVMQALRQPHVWWQIGAAIVRRRWLRPLAPVFMSPIVAIYCRARRQLKKRGVARRRWACSLCRRRARWKCVRCLRSYYCSRQCQNVSWHIIHKHVCYKPGRFWWSVVVYGSLAIALFPGALRDPFMYDLGLLMVPLSFVIASVLGGGIATMVKTVAGRDLRGRILEFVVVVVTLFLSVVSWGLVRGFFGDSTACYGVMGSMAVSNETMGKMSMLGLTRWLLLGPAQSVYVFLDQFILRWRWTRIFCIREGPAKGCFEHLPNANADFILEEVGGEKCASDYSMMIGLFIAAAVSYVANFLLKEHERERRRLARRHAHHE